MKEFFKKEKAKKLTPYLVAIVIFVTLTIAYVNPVLEGKGLLQDDNVKWRGMVQEIENFRDKHGEEPLWTNSMFGGMPAYQISVIWSSNISNFFHDIMTLWLPRPADMIFLYFAGFFILLLLMRINPYLAITGAVAFAFASYNFIILDAGHNSKAIAIGYMAPVLGAIIYTFRGNYLSGGLLFAIFMSLQLFANHYQMTYYLLIIVVIFGLFELYEAIQQKKYKEFLKPIGVLFIGLIIAIGVNIGNIWATYAYAPNTMRGGTELTIGDRETSDGLSKEYITAWSYGKIETFSLMIPNIKGGATGALGNNPKALEEVDNRFRGEVAQWNHYWGDQPFTSGPVYAGAIVILFFAIGLYLFKGKLKWVLLISTILSILLSWGKNFMPLTDFFIDYIPWYNKFRAVSMTLVIASLCIPFIAIKGLQKIIDNPNLIKIKDRKFLIAVGLTAGLTFLFYLSPQTFFSFFSKQETEMIAAQASDPQATGHINMLVNNIENARAAIFKADASRSLLFMLISLVALLLFTNKKIGKYSFIAIITIFIITDMWVINKRYLNNEDFTSLDKIESPVTPTRANLQILNDPNKPDTNFRVFNTSTDPFNESNTSFFHFSIGGYHGAKLQRYQDLIDIHISRGNMNVLNMLNTSYFIVRGEDHQPQAQRNPGTLGNAWFVTEYKLANNADEEILALDNFDPSKKAIIDKRFENYIEGKVFKYDSIANIELVNYRTNKLVYESVSEKEQLAVFSEIFYEDGWEAYINGEPAPHFRANYVLRAMVIPPGENEIKFYFKPRLYHMGSNLAFIFSAITVILILSYIAKIIYTFNKKQ